MTIFGALKYAPKMHIWPIGPIISVAESDLIHMMSQLELPVILKHRDESKDQNRNQVSTRIHL